ncbi:MAG: TolC family protein [Pseudomonadota bacterium]|nr:TolC family protein [Pseudomonadota bacterium]
MPLHALIHSPARGAVRAALCGLSAALLMPTVPAFAQERLSLDRVVEMAVARAPMLDARSAQVEAARQEAVRAGALPDPMLTFGMANQPVTGDDAFDPDADFMTMRQIGVRQEIPAAAKRQARRELAAREVDEAAVRADVQRLQVRRAAAEAWIELWAAQREFDAVEDIHEEAELASRLARARVAGGSVTASDALATDMAVLELGNRLEAARASREAAQAALARWAGEARIVPAAESPDFTRLPVAEEELLAELGRLVSLLPIIAATETAAAAVDVARAEKRPDWSVAASYGQRGAGRSDMLMVEVGIDLPLFTRNRQDRGIAARQADYQAVLATREDLHRQHTAEVRASLARWEGLKRQVARDREALLPLARDRDDTSLAAYRAGGPVGPWLDARRDHAALLVDHSRREGALGLAWAALAYLLTSEPQR